MCTKVVAVHGQEKENLPQGVFLNDTIVVGKPFSYAFSYRHGAETEVFFPDSSYDFSPFTFLHQEFYTTRTDTSGSLDSTIYTLVAFEVKPRQVLRLPVYVLADVDCTAVYTAPDTVYLKLTLPATSRPDTLSLLPETEIGFLQRQFNYPVFLAALLTLGFVSFIIYWLFGTGILRQWRIFQLHRRHSEFVRAFNRFNRTARERDSTVEAEKAVVLWKNYLERVEKKPFATYTTREIVDNIPDEALENALKDIDRIIYGQVKSEKMDPSLQVLKNVAQRLYRQRRLEISRKNKETIQ
ncbi:hypothetical protein EZE20_16390 [Arundinibacter roseus]|uniref:Uncharacterized protein n=1 Tax=Arundinibacter roseus TaxID=2070510 RepID=A0A4R4KA18_9BACT|nr:hypothetical protein EZE20_16390 [Arundinibacter roseus]